MPLLILFGIITTPVWLPKKMLFFRVQRDKMTCLEFVFKISQTEKCKYCMTKNLEQTNSLKQKVEKETGELLFNGYRIQVGRGKKF